MSDDKEQVLKRPIMIHRAILGSLERFIAILTEHTAGKWPVWLSPRQVCVCTVKSSCNEFAMKVVKKLRNNGIYADIDGTNRTLPKKIREAQKILKKYLD